MSDNQRARFLQQYGSVADRVSAQTGISRDVLLSQWGLETGWGKSMIPWTNNLGNIKDFSGRGVSARDNMTGSRDAYRAYATPDAFGDDYVSLITRRYPGALGAGDDVMRFSSALKAGGYAEDPRYVSKMASIYGSLTGVPTAARDIGAPTSYPIDTDALYGIAPSAGGATGPKIEKITTAPGAVSRGMAAQQKQDAAPTAPAQTTDYSAWIDNYIRSIVNNA